VPQTVFYAWAVALVLVASANATDLQAWSSGEFTVLQTRKAQLQVSATARTRDHVSELYDSRLAGVLTLPVSRRLAVRAAYLLRSVTLEGNRDRQNRFFFGPRFTALQRRVKLDLIGWYERHTHVATRPAFNRYKAGFDLERQHRGVSPFLYVEQAVLDGALSRSRHIAGVRLRSESGYEIEVGYQFETLNTGSAWAPRHSLRSTFRWNQYARFNRQ
jgi:hypothetical protein